MSFGLGHYKTKGNYRAIVTRIKSNPTGWTLYGAIECPHTEAMVIARWDVSGRCLISYAAHTASDLGEKTGELAIRRETA